MTLERDLIVALLTEVHSHVAEAAVIAKASEACARDGYAEKAFTIALDVEQLLFDANNLLQAASVINRKIGTDEQR